MNQELLNKAFELLEKMLLPAKLASTGVDGRGNGFRITEYYTKNYQGREVATPDALAKIFYEAVLKDVNQEVNGGQKGSLVWTILPKKLVAHYKALRREDIHHVSESAVKREEHRAVESPDVRKANLKAMDREFDALGPMAPAAVKFFIESIRGDGSYDSTEALLHLKTTLQLSTDSRAVAHQLKKFLESAQ